MNKNPNDYPDSNPKVAVIIVTHNSERHIHKCMECLLAQTSTPEQIIIVDSGSTNCEYLQQYTDLKGVDLTTGNIDIGFCKGNNLGLTRVHKDIDYVLFLNPDAFAMPSFIRKALSFMEDKSNARCGALTGTTLGYSIEKNAPTGLYDTTGIFRSWWGRWYDRGQGEVRNPQKYTTTEQIPAICGAVYFCRNEAIKDVLLPSAGITQECELFDTRFYMYKEDIDLSLRLKKRGWKLMFVPEVVAFHCRGWNPDRKTMPQKMRMHSATNELRIQWKQKSPIPLLYSFFKYCAVKYLNI